MANIQNIGYHFVRHFKNIFLGNPRLTKVSCQDLSNEPELSHFLRVELELWIPI